MSGDLAFDFVDGFPSEDEIFSVPIGWDGELGDSADLNLGVGAGISPLDVGLEWTKRRRLEDLEAYWDDDLSTAEGMAILVQLAAREYYALQPGLMQFCVPGSRPYAGNLIPEQLTEAARETSTFQRELMHFSVPESPLTRGGRFPEQLVEAACATSALQPRCSQFRGPESPPITGLVREQLAPFARVAPALLFDNMSFRRCADPVISRRTPGRSIPNVAPSSAPGTSPRRRRPRANAPDTGRSILEHRPLLIQISGADPAAISAKDLQTKFKHPFYPSLVPIMYYGANNPQVSPNPAPRQAFSAPSIDSTVMTVLSPIRPVQEAQHPMFVDSQIRLPPLTLKDLEGHLTSSGHLCYDQSPALSSTDSYHAHDEQAEPVPVIGLQQEQAPGTDPIHNSSRTASSDCALCNMDLWGSVDSISSPPNRIDKQATVANPKTRSKPRFTWTPELILMFESAVAFLGGPEKATPKAILGGMAVPGISSLNLKSRLQIFRLHLGIPPGIFRGTKRSVAAPRVTQQKKRPA